MCSFAALVLEIICDAIGSRARGRVDMYIMEEDDVGLI